MFDSGYLIPSLVEKISPPDDPSSNFPPRSLLGRWFMQVVEEYVPSTTNERTTFQSSSHLASVITANPTSCVFYILFIFSLLITPLIQLYLFLSRFKFRQKNPSSKLRQFSAILLVIVLIWLLTSLAFLSIVIFYSENLDFVASNQNNMSSVLDHVDSVANRSVSLLRNIAVNSLPPVNDFAIELTNDLYKLLLNEVPTMTNQFLKLTDLGTPLALLADLAKMVDNLLEAHIFLRVNGPQVALEFDKFDSNIKINAMFLASEIAYMRSVCASNRSLPPEFYHFEQLVSKLANGFQTSSTRTKTFFQLFQLESSLGLFNMLNVLPFNVSEVMDQLRTAMKVRDDLELSIRNKTVRYFSTLSWAKNTSGTSWLEPHFFQFSAFLDDSASAVHRRIAEVKPELEDALSYRLLVYIVALLTLAMPLSLLVCSCLCPSSKADPKESYPRLISSSSRAETELNSRSASLNKMSSLERTKSKSTDIVPRKTTSSSSRISASFVSPILKQKLLDCEAEVDIQYAKKISFSSRPQTPSCWPSVKQKSFDTSYGYEFEEINRLEGMHLKPWGQTEASASENIAKSPSRGRCLGASSTRIYTKRCTCAISCCGLTCVTLISLVLVFLSGFVHLQVCMPFSSEPHQRNLDNEINALIDHKWNHSMAEIDAIILKYLNPSSVSLSSFTSPPFNGSFSTLLRIKQPKNIVHALFTKCMSDSYYQSSPTDLKEGNESFFDAVDVSLEFNLSDALKVPGVMAYSNTFKASFSKEAVELMLGKLASGLLPANFELLLANLRAEQILAKNATSLHEELDDKELEMLEKTAAKSEKEEELKVEGGVLNTVDRFWSQSIEGAVDRENAILTSLHQFRQIRRLLKQLSRLQRQLRTYLLRPSHPLVTQCSNHLKSLLDITHYSLRVIRSSQKAFHFRNRTSALLDAAKTLRVISMQPSFTKTLNSFADLAYSMGLSQFSPLEGKNDLVYRVKTITEMEYDRLTGMLLGELGSGILNSRLKKLLSKVTSPCSNLGDIANEVVGTVCPLHSTPLQNPTFVPLLLRISTLALITVLFVLAFQALFTFHTCLTRPPRCHFQALALTPHMNDFLSKG